MRCLAHMSILDIADAMEESCARQTREIAPAALPLRANDDALPAADGFGIDAVRFLAIDPPV